MNPLYRSMVITTFLVSFATTAFPIFLPSYFSEIGLSNFEIGLSLAVLYITAALLSLLVGLSEERVSKVKILVTSYFFYALLPVLYLSISGFLSIILVRIYDGFVSSMRYVSRYSVLETRRAYSTGINVCTNEASSHLASLLGPLAAGVIAVYFGMGMIFAFATVILLVAAAYSIRMLKLHKIKPLRGVTLSLPFRELLSNRPLLVLSVIFLLFSMIGFSKFMAVTLYMKSLGFDGLAIGIVGSSFFFFMFLFELFSGRLEKKRLRNGLLVGGLLTSGLSVFLFSVSPTSLYFFLFLALLFSLGEAFIRPAIFSDLVAIEKDKSNVGTGILFFFSNIGGAIGLLLSGIITQISFQLFFVFGAGVLLVSSLIGLLYLRIQ